MVTWSQISYIVLAVWVYRYVGIVISIMHKRSFEKSGALKYPDEWLRSEVWLWPLNLIIDAEIEVQLWWLNKKIKKKTSKKEPNHL